MLSRSSGFACSEPLRRSGPDGKWLARYYHLLREARPAQDSLLPPLDPTVHVATADPAIYEKDEWLVATRDVALAAEGPGPKEKGSSRSASSTGGTGGGGGSGGGGGDDDDDEEVEVVAPPIKVSSLTALLVEYMLTLVFARKRKPVSSSSRAVTGHQGVLPLSRV